MFYYYDIYIVCLGHSSFGFMNEITAYRFGERINNDIHFIWFGTFSYSTCTCGHSGHLHHFKQCGPLKETDPMWRVSSGRAL